MRRLSDREKPKAGDNKTPSETLKGSVDALNFCFPKGSKSSLYRTTTGRCGSISPGLLLGDFHDRGDGPNRLARRVVDVSNSPGEGR